MAAVQVVPIPRVSGCAFASAKIAPLAPQTALFNDSSGSFATAGPAPTNCRLIASAAIRAARSPAAAPPIPSQTNNKIPCCESRDLRPAARIAQIARPQVGDHEGVLIFASPGANIRRTANRQMMVAQDDRLAQAKRCFSFAATRAVAAAPSSSRSGLLPMRRFARPGMPFNIARGCDLVIGLVFLAAFLFDLAALLDFLAVDLMG